VVKKTKIAALAMITQRRQMYAIYVDFDSVMIFMRLCQSKEF